MSLLENAAGFIEVTFSYREICGGKMGFVCFGRIFLVGGDEPYLSINIQGGVFSHRPNKDSGFFLLPFSSKDPLSLRFVGREEVVSHASIRILF